METAITRDIRISVETAYQQDISVNEHIFSYHILIENNSGEAVKLLHRHWDIFDSNATLREVNGDGVVGLQPVILPGEKFDYQSCCNLKTEMGTMSGYYIMKRLSDGKKFRVLIPEFRMVASFKLN